MDLITTGRFAGNLTLDIHNPNKIVLFFTSKSICKLVKSNHLDATISLFTYEDRNKKEKQIRLSFFNKVNDNFPYFCASCSANLIDGQYYGHGNFEMTAPNKSSIIETSVKFITNEQDKNLYLLGEWKEQKNNITYKLSASLKRVDN